MGVCLTREQLASRLKSNTVEPSFVCRLDLEAAGSPSCPGPSHEKHYVLYVVALA